MKTEVLIVGGSFAGLSAAMQLVRGRRNVIVVDANKPRNRFAAESHGVFCLDGKTPAEIRATALAQLQAYPTFRLIDDSAVDVEQTQGGFSVTLAGGASYHTQKLILATGITDRLPNIPGVKEHWGKSVIHCPYCHGYELQDRALGVLATGEMSFHQAALIPDWGATTLFTQGQFKPEAEVLEHLIQRGVGIEDCAITQVVGDGEKIQYVALADGRQIPIKGLYVAPQVTITTPLVAKLKLETVEAPLGAAIKVDDFKESSTPGVFVAGDLSNPMQSATFAIASGTMAGIAAHRALIFNH
ncbi:NAD(P)/FAD-dependent oxidoreductase [Gilvimarinus agarilyticus]|uniref:NAD(P)/FAD-dependent oxidoreductase n=1 Tax=Gilvimarinus sp. 2_MG-2023 TaxID=3062666 RepID=UPI001C091892|nr:NAD(P)/FAD-dependent oxidoreductase [Gilvimarinus sp. 2_MG-2023]MBU2887774.1 NAD(P)/FAD-dependent oxidoreductase [Gilvimarinus agarilyticus]MDO6572413.1 NAD(P)/FAD-dependent oxidoreductase [Gilvimarinus sp. 2_MG-2023]